MLLFLKGNLFAQKQVSNIDIMKALARGTNWKLQALNQNNTPIYYKHLYKNGNPYGKSVHLVYDEFFDTVSLSFMNEDGFSQEIKVKNLDFIDNLKFKYKGSVYRIDYY